MVISFDEIVIAMSVMKKRSHKNEFFIVFYEIATLRSQ